MFSRGLNEIHVHGAQHGAQTRQLPCLTYWVVWLLEIPKALQPPPPRFVEGSWKLCGSGPCPHLCLPPSTCDFPTAAVPKYPRLGGFDTRNVLPCSSGGRKSRGRTLSGVVPSGGSEAGICPRPLPWLLVAAGSPWCSLACRSVTLILSLSSCRFLGVCMSVFKSPLFIRTSVLLANHNDLFVPRLPLLKTLSPF